MTTIIIRKNHEGIYRGFYCMGHAEYAKKRLFGKEPDILCAAISVTVQSTIMALNEMVGEKLQLTQNEETGFIKCDFENSIPQDKTVFLMDFMVFSLKKLSSQYGEQYLQVKIEEV